MTFETRRLNQGVDLSECAAMNSLWAEDWIARNTHRVTFEAPDIETAERMLPIGCLKRPYLREVAPDAGNSL